MEEPKPIRAKVLAGGAGSSLAIPLMVIVAYILEAGFEIELPAPVIVACSGLIASVGGVVAAYMTRE